MFLLATLCCPNLLLVLNPLYVFAYTLPLEYKHAMTYTFSSVVTSLISTHVFVTLQRLDFWNETTNAQVYDHQLVKSYLDGEGGSEVFSFSDFPWDTLYILLRIFSENYVRIEAHVHKLCKLKKLV